MKHDKVVGNVLVKISLFCSTFDQKKWSFPVYAMETIITKFREPRHANTAGYPSTFHLPHIKQSQASGCPANRIVIGFRYAYT
ncbi:MAG: hypothetical protein D4R64_15260 [Porphyromonadaceae bacterium]|nr:MAG: hypothetical protein D4R64_15260 [Porphyromonadaceae bacterium]